MSRRTFSRATVAVLALGWSVGIAIGLSAIGCNSEPPKRNQGDPATRTSATPNSTDTTAAAAESAATAAGEVLVIKVNMHCSGCATNVKKVIEAVPGATVLECSFETDECRVAAPESLRPQIIKAIQAANYETP